MSLPITPNVRVDIHRAADPDDPYPAGSPAATVDGYLKPTMLGRHGVADWLKWTHLLLLPAETDVRDAYNTQLDPAHDPTDADTVIVHDSADPDIKTAYFVVYAEVIAFGAPHQYRCVYLDRFVPNQWPTDSM